MNRPKTTASDLPPRMLRRVRTLASGKRWEGYYYDGRDETGKRKEIPLGIDLNEPSAVAGVPGIRISQIEDFVVTPFEVELSAREAS